ncbi:hypothetical protein [Parabacteroides bouchesdurhonensis]|uniref:hypothetical protein n=1 Tax=Parabacteroides bouchesdurhonensis TaxID=1936995 RepID=UPI000E4D7E27|nr:hypothetical protein [Parabacteroides bouchesdurhonensis]RHJ94171.1 hypothetical protein DW095_04070 [Bacteroides sp. AM07-16]
MELRLPISVFELLLYYFVPIIILFLLYGIGWGIKYFIFKQKDRLSAYSILISSVLGLAVLVTIYSIVMTRGITANWMMLVLFAMYCIFRKKQYFSSRKIHPFSSSILFYVSIILFVNGILYIFFLYRVIDFEKGMFSSVFADFDFYAKCSQYLNKGYENILLEYNFSKYIAPLPYHYFELWVNAFMYKFGGLNAAVCYMISLPMVFISLIFYGLLAVIETRSKISLYYLLVAFSLLCISDVLFCLTDLFPFIKGTSYRLSFPKLLPVVLFLEVVYVCLLYKHKIKAYYFLLSIPIMNIIPLIGVWGCVGFLLLITIYKAKRINWLYVLPYILLIVLYLVYVMQASSRATHWSEPFSWNLLRLYLTQPLLYILLYIQVLFPIVLINKRIGCFFYKKYIYIYLLLCFLVITASILLRPYNYDATQFVSGTVHIFVYVFVTCTFMYALVWTKLLLKKRILLIFILLFNCWCSFIGYKSDIQQYTTKNLDYESEILSKLPICEEYKIGFYIGENVRLGDGGNYVSGVVDAITIPDVLDYYHNNVIHYSINKGKEEAKWSTDHTPFRDYYAKCKSQSSDISDDEIRINFIKDNNIEYIRIYKSAIPTEWFLSHLTLLAEDEINGERFYKVNIL